MSTAAAVPERIGGSEPLSSTWRPAWPVEPAEVLASLHRGGRDPAFRRAGDGTVWRVSPTPDGPATLRIAPRRALGVVELEAWGPGAAWAIETAPRMLGRDDDVTDFAPTDPRVRAAWTLGPNWRVACSGNVLEALVGCVIEQKVTGQEAHQGWRALLYRFGPPAPGPAAAWGMRCCPDAAQLLAVPSWEWLRCHIDGARSAPIMRAARVASSLERLVDVPPEEADRRLRSLAGIGVWTSAEIRQRALGDADAVIFGDYHIAGHVGYALTGEKVDDQGMAALLEPERPHRYRVQHIVTTRMPGPPRRGPRMAPRTHLPR